MKTNMSNSMGWICLALALATLEAAQSGSAAEALGSTTDPNTGETLTVYKNADGTRDVVRTDANGKEISRETHGNEPPTKVEKNKEPDSVSTRDGNGNTTTVTSNGDGTKTKTVTDNDGNLISKEKIEKEPVTKVEKKKEPDSVSTRDSNGNTTTVTSNGDGTKTKTVTDKNGNLISKEKIEKEPVTKVEKKKEPDGGSSVNPDNGRKTEVIDNGNGTKTIVITDKNGKELHRETINLGQNMSDEGYNYQRVTSDASPILVQPERVYVERRVVIEDRSPRFSVGIGFGFGMGGGHHKHCAPPPCHKKCK